HPEPHRFDTSYQSAMIQLVPVPASFQPLFVNDSQGLAQRIVHRDRRRVMISPILAPIAFNHRDIEIPALHFRMAGTDAIQRALGESDRRESWRRSQTFLGSRIANVDL